MTLSDLLKTRPVLMIWGHYTCPAFQGYKSDTMFLHSSYQEEYDLVEAYQDKVFFLHMVGPEPHPIWPFANFDSGSIKLNYWSVIGSVEARYSSVIVLMMDVVNLRPIKTACPFLSQKSGTTFIQA